MSQAAPRPDVDDDAEAALHRALVALHALSPDHAVARERLPEPYRGRDIGADLAAVAAASTRQIPVSARLAVLYDLAKAGYPGEDAYQDAYHALADSAVRFRLRRDEDEGVAPGDLLQDLRVAAEQGEPYSTRPTARRTFRHHEVAFVGQSVCSIERVRVDGVRAAWIYSEFETDAPFERIADWLDPHHWPDLGPMFFKKMELVGSDQPVPLAAPPEGAPHWHGVFLEEVQLVRRLRTLLRCTYWRDGAGTAATTYDLSDSLDDEIDVDRGYLLVTDTGAVRRVQALKIVSFTEDLWDTVALFICPFWTDWIRGAVQDGGSTTTTPPSHVPGARSPLGQSVEDWIEYFGEAVQPYLDLCTDASSRMRSGSYTSGDALADGTRWWSRFAQDWARAWTNWSDTVQRVADEGLDAGLTPPGAPPERGRGTAGFLAAPAAPEPGGTVFAVPDLGATERPVCSELVSIERGAATIPPDAVTVTVEHGRDGTRRVRLRTTSTSAPLGLYVGRLRTTADQDLAPVQLYVSRTTRV